MPDRTLADLAFRGLLIALLGACTVAVGLRLVGVEHRVRVLEAAVPVEGDDDSAKACPPRRAPCRLPR